MGSKYLTYFVDFIGSLKGQEKEVFFQWKKDKSVLNYVLTTKYRAFVSLEYKIRTDIERKFICWASLFS